jgi:hypothetical protein
MRIPRGNRLAENSSKEKKLIWRFSPWGSKTEMGKSKPLSCSRRRENELGARATTTKRKPSDALSRSMGKIKQRKTGEGKTQM